MDVGLSIVIVVAIYAVTSLVRDKLQNDRNKDMQTLNFKRYGSGDPMRDVAQAEEEEVPSE
jgi:hypothetical protein